MWWGKAVSCWADGALVHIEADVRIDTAPIVCSLRHHTVAVALHPKYEHLIVYVTLITVITVFKHIFLVGVSNTRLCSAWERTGGVLCFITVQTAGFPDPGAKCSSV